ncbi:MAG: tRNA pseudouridine(38-40) synthase TruA [Bacteroidota bacterium]|nr:tRNA pseudouridine(38-40) synthase TruA [Bacteroidota bacterium]
MPRFFLKLSFKGTAYAGWQVQENAVSVQEKLNAALSILLNKETATTGCGRTDTGVHAKQFYVHFDADVITVPYEKIVYALNAILPNDIAIESMFPVADDQHARFDASRRIYEYFISTSKNPFLKDYTMFSVSRPDINRMTEATHFLVRKTDFSSFSKSNTQVKTNICDITRADWEVRNDLLVFTITADRFLRGMVRAIVGTLLEIGASKIPPHRIMEIIELKNRSEAGVTVPACGLYLSQIDYPFLESTRPNSFPA